MAHGSTGHNACTTHRNSTTPPPPPPPPPVKETATQNLEVNRHTHTHTRYITYLSTRKHARAPADSSRSTPNNINNNNNNWRAAHRIQLLAWRGRNTFRAIIAITHTQIRRVCVSVFLCFFFVFLCACICYFFPPSIRRIRAPHIILDCKLRVSKDHSDRSHSVPNCASGRAFMCHITQVRAEGRSLLSVHRHTATNVCTLRGRN